MPDRAPAGPFGPRRVALEVVRAVAERDAYANLALPPLLRRHRLSGRDAAFATELTYGTLRRLGTLDAVLARCSDRPPDRIDPPVLAALRVGAYQLLFLRVAGHAGVHATVELVREVAGERPVRFANAVLRAVTARDWPGWRAELAGPDDDRWTALGLDHGYPRWIVAALADALGGDPDETERALGGDDRPVVHLAARPGRIDRAELLAQTGDRGEPGPYAPYAVRLVGGGDPAALPAVAAGAAGVQDEGSQLVALALARAALDGPDRRWLDVCAGPGGKAALLAGVAAERAAGLLAAELAPHRARLVADALRPGPGRVVVADGRRPAWPDGGFDRVLVDAPCTGLGALRRRPEARWRRRPADVDRLVPLQRELLHRALDATRPGGLVLYATCSPHPAETVGVVTAVLGARADAVTVDVRAALGAPDVGPGPWAQLWPHRHGTDAMFCALLRRSADLSAAPRATPAPL